jgi:hypothetical protein
MVAAIVRPPRTALLALIAILALAAALRLIGLRYGLPAVYNPDEVAIMSRALAFAKGDLNPHNFLYPTFYFYVLFAWLGASFVISWLTGAVASVAAFQTQFFTDPTPIYVAGRLLGATCGTLTVALAYVLGTKITDRRADGHSRGHARHVMASRDDKESVFTKTDSLPSRPQITGLIAALSLAVAPGHVRDSHYVKHDVPVTLAIVIAQLAMLRLLQRDAPQRPMRFVLAGAACGVACSTHYYAVFLAFPLLLAIVFATRAEGWRAMVTRAAQAGAAAAIVFFALSPFLLVEPGTAWRDILANRQIVVDRAVTARHVLFGNLGVYLRMLWDEAISWPVCVAALIGAALMLRARDGRATALVLLAFALPFLLFISNTVAASRYLNPILPTCACFAAFAITRIPALAPRAPRAGIGALAVAMSLPGLLLSLRLDTFFRQPDTRTLAQQFIERTVPPGATILVQPYSVPLTQSRESLLEALQAHLGNLHKTPPPPKFALRLALTPYPTPAYRTIYLGEGGLDQDKIYLSYARAGHGDADEALRHVGVQYIVLKRYNVPDPAVEPLRARLERYARLLATFSPYEASADAATRARVAPFLHNTDTPCDPALERPGPGIEVWQVPGARSRELASSDCF